MKEVRADLEGQIADIEEEAWQIAGDQFPLSNLDAKRWVLFGEGVQKNNVGHPIPVYGAQQASSSRARTCRSVAAPRRPTWRR